MIEYGLLVLLLPVAAVSGWYAGRRGSARHAGQKVSRLSTTYFRGLNYLLNEQPDKAIEVFLKIAEVDKRTVETQFALGNLFRRRGEVDRAIRVHQNLIARQGLTDEHKSQALLELGEDYMRAGLLDRAETLFCDLVAVSHCAPDALRHLIAIYQQERDWHKAIEHASRLEEVTGESSARMVAQFHCELAEQARIAGRIEEARDQLKSAFEVEANCVRAGLIEGKLDILEGQDAAAIRSLERVARHDPDIIPELLKPLMQAYERREDWHRARAFLAETLERHPGVSVLLALTRLIEREDGADAAIDFLTNQLRRRPSVRGQGALIELSLAKRPQEERDVLLVLRQLCDQLVAGAPAYRCGHCGFGARSHHWQCPSCKNWGTVKPIHGAAGE
ncbi:MAG: lipopolysaccharide assembly protein LapB [Xanthomonadales bacterium]|nr:lipopolysaccharide assembly protein LapB [Xanthomonadales bacterium]